MRPLRDSLPPNPCFIKLGVPRRRFRRKSAIAVTACFTFGLALLAGASLLAVLIAAGWREPADTAPTRSEILTKFADEDQLAALRGEILARDQQNAQLEAALGALEQHSAQLEGRLSALAALAARLDPASAQLMRSAPQKLGLRGSDTGVDAATRLLADQAALTRIETASLATTEKLLGSVAAENARITAALDDAGLAPERLTLLSRSAPLGGPIEAPPGPPPSGATKFGRAYAALNEAMARRAFLRAALPHAPLRAPLTGPHEISSGYGYRIDPFFGRPTLHGGMDFVGRLGEAVHAAASGTVTAAGETGSYGALVEIDHGGGLVTRYGHLSEIFVVEGQKIVPGAQIGAIGSSGRSTGPHLHYEIRDDGAAVDPAPFLKAGRQIEPTS